MKIMLTGANGQVGWELSRRLTLLGEVVALQQDKCDLSHVEKIPSIVHEIQPDVIINAAAYTAVDLAEREEALATTINGTAVGVLAQEAEKRHVLLVHYSTDYVFDGTKPTPYKEDDVPNPINAYGRSKLAGEEAIRQSGCSHYIFRTSWIHSPRRSNFIRTILSVASERDELKIVTDQIGSPTSASLIAEVTVQVLQSCFGKDGQNRSNDGIYHLTASGETSWYEYAKWVLQVAMDSGISLKVTPDLVVPIPTSGYETKAKRPLNSRLDVEKLRTAFSVQLPDWKYGVSQSVGGIVHCQC